MKTSLSAARLATDPAIARTRENGAELARAGRAGKLLRSAFRLQMLNARDRSATSRLTRQMMHVVKTDPVSPRGERNVEKACCAGGINADSIHQEVRKDLFYYPAPFPSISPPDDPRFFPGIHTHRHGCRLSYVHYSDRRSLYILIHSAPTSSVRYS